ncbi:recombinase family protein [Streptomyces sp. DH37]|uniref:recombinase family protein n=1 Tax=Streptomyces sp. DH37 TaxID=3040122 RepID=UPI00244301E9|nr:recombinase family protein [Streptomyces sp. DH37]MDG9703728.1 recombinase family protein [Streptomyces sp. DH37]
MAPQGARLPRRAGIYCRLSYAPDGSLEKVERQEGDCRELGARLRWPISERHIFVDNSRSAWQRNRRRPAWDAMLAAVEAGEIDALLIYHGDRLIRQPFDLEKLISIADQKGVRVASPSGTRDLDSADDRFILRIEAAQACRESDNISRRMKRGHLARAVKGGRGTQGGRRPFGWGAPTGRTKVKVDKETGEETEVEVLDHNKTRPEEIDYLVRVVDRLMAGQSTAGVLRWLNVEEKVFTTAGNPWTSKVLWKLLLSPRMIGMIERDGVLYKAAWDEVISPETQEQLRALHAVRVAQRNTMLGDNLSSRRVHVLSCLTECGVCGSTDTPTKPVAGTKRRGKAPHRVYYCRSCGGFARKVELLNAYVEGRTVRLLNDRRFLAELEARAGAEAPALGAQIAELERRKRATEEQVRNLADHPDVDPGLALAAVASFDAKIAELRAQMTADANTRLLVRMAGVTRERWEKEPVDDRATVIAALWRIVVSPTAQRGPGFDPASVQLTRKRLAPAGKDREPSGAGVSRGG